MNIKRMTARIFVNNPKKEQARKKKMLYTHIMNKQNKWTNKID